jgi:flagellar biosynthesis protein FliR
MEIEFYTWMLVFLRASAFLLSLPFFSMANMPVTMRVALAALVAILLAPIVPQFSLGDLGLISILEVMAQEVAIGLLLGFVCRMIFFAVDIAGTVISNELGLNMASLFDPVTQQSSAMAGTILMMLATLLMFTMNLHHWMLLGFERTYTVLPIGGAHLHNVLFENIVTRTSGVFTVALQMAAPVICVSFVITLVFSLLSRTVPQMNVFSEMFGFRIVGGLIVFGFTLQLTAQYIANYLNRLPDDMLIVAQMMGGR